MMVDGYVFEIGGRIKGSGINGILLGVAQMGIVKITIGYSILLAIIGFRIFSKVKSRSEIASLKRPRR
ncbi:hypothetical protein SAMN05216480_11263 [Pustulibacterium marinum]|uniref:Uncharacterized protein n=1 Tax=Pustulibacterium marinum TaxID=1224947 RepID=A0A1I7I1G0_9FLAO|nr:hypothetical protein [Pustulibacterium marinum]SFU66774.1 hypothetical protein SAMN05216480_11263 [Pustulibacterium marinum]